jgi:glycosyltransferase involved in cell wall biosynthesis
MNTYIFNNTVPTEQGMSGSDRRALEYARCFIAKGHQVTLVLPRVALSRYENMKASFLITDNSGEGARLSPLFLVRRIKMAQKACQALKIYPQDIIYSSSDILADSIPALQLKQRNKNARLICGLHLIAPLPWKGFRHAFTKGWQIPRLKDTYYYFSQRYILGQLKRHADLVLVSNSFDRDNLIRNGFRQERVLVCYGAPERDVIAKAASGKKEFDGVFIGRYHEQKGFMDLIKFTREICASKKDFRLALISDIPEKTFSEISNRYNLQKVIVFFGFKNGIDKFAIMKQAKVLICPSYYESFGMVVVEAMSCGLPVLAYDLPIYKAIYPRGMIRVKIGDFKGLTQSLLNLLTDESGRQELSGEALELSKQFSWEKTSEDILQRLT